MGGPKKLDIPPTKPEMRPARGRTKGSALGERRQSNRHWAKSAKTKMLQPRRKLANVLSASASTLTPRTVPKGRQISMGQNR